MKDHIQNYSVKGLQLKKNLDRENLYISLIKDNTKVTEGPTGPDQLRYKIETKFLNIATRNPVEFYHNSGSQVTKYKAEYKQPGYTTATRVIADPRL